MTVTQTTPRYSTAPGTTPLLGTLLHTATVEPGIEYLVEGRDIFESFNRMSFGRTAVFCGVNAKTFDQASTWVQGVPFVAYGGVLCNAVGLDQADQLTEVTRVFSDGESVAVEAAVMDLLFSPTAPSTFAVPTDITPAGGAVKPKVGIAMIEGWMARRYVGTPTIHLPTVIASLVMGADGVAAEQDVLMSKLGSKIVNGAGYDEPNVSPAGAANPAGERWIYGTGEVLVRQGDVIAQQAFNQSNNQVTTLAERPYVIAVDGPVVAVRVQVTA